MKITPRRFAPWLVVLFLIFSGCATKNSVAKEDQESAFIVIRTPSMQYADQGFIYKKPDWTKIEIYGMGQPLLSIEINGMNICMSTFECMSKRDFNAKVLDAHYPPTLLEHIFRGEAIFDKQGFVPSRDGFSQKVTKKGEYDISYTVTATERKFRDKINNILIKVREQ